MTCFFSSLDILTLHTTLNISQKQKKSRSLLNFACMYLCAHAFVLMQGKGTGDEVSTQNIKTTSMAQSKSYGQFSIVSN